LRGYSTRSRRLGGDGRWRSQTLGNPAYDGGLVGGVVVDAQVEGRQRLAGEREPEQMAQRSRGVVAVDAVGVVPAAGVRPAAAHALDEARAARSVDAAEAEHARAESAVEEQALGLQHAQPIEVSRLGRALLVDPLAGLLRVDGRARGEEREPRRVVAGPERVAQAVDVGGAIGLVRGAVGRCRIHQRVEGPAAERPECAAQRRAVEEIGGDRHDGRGEALGMAA